MLSYTLCGGLGDFILHYLGSPGDRLFALRDKITNFRCSNNPAGIDLIKGNPFFKEFESVIDDGIHTCRLPNDILYIKNLESYPKSLVPVWLSPEEKIQLNSLVKPYIAFHPFARTQDRSLENYENIIKIIEKRTGIPVLLLEEGKFSSRLSVKIVEGSSFFVGTHSSMQCAAWVYNIPSICIGPGSLYLHNYYAPNSFDLYLKPLFKDKNVFIQKEQINHFPRFLDYFLQRL